MSSDLAIVTAALAGEPEGFRELELVLESLPFSDEVLQAVRHRALVERKLATFDGRGSLRGWLKAVAARLEVDLRRGTREDSTEDGLLERLLPPSSGLESELVTTEARTLLRGAMQAALERLPVRDRLWVQLHYLDGMTLSAIAELHGVAPSTVMRALRGAVEELKALVRSHLVDAHRLGTASVDSLVRWGVV